MRYLLRAGEPVVVGGHVGHDGALVRYRLVVDVCNTGARRPQAVSSHGHRQGGAAADRHGTPCSVIATRTQIMVSTESRRPRGTTCKAMPLRNTALSGARMYTLWFETCWQCVFGAAQGARTRIAGTRKEFDIGQRWAVEQERK